MNPAKVLMDRLTKGLNDVAQNCQANQAAIRDEFSRLEERITRIETLLENGSVHSVKIDDL